MMLQQTQADRVAPFYLRFLAAFPTVEALAAATLGEVLVAWNGLGYNRRARMLHEAAGIVAAEGWPVAVGDLAALPGVGPYTARALAAFAFGAQVAAIDTNVRRVVSRWHGEPLSGQALELAALSDLGDAAATWNQAVMDLGATVCLARGPRCDQCPVSQWCAGPDVYTPARAQGRFEGSARQVRGALIRRLVTGPAPLDRLAAETGFDVGRVHDALADLASEGMVEETSDGHYQLPAQ
jgi:A/G-specific adenine glycosylase